jgi:hypothetical protein
MIGYSMRCLLLCVMPAAAVSTMLPFQDLAAMHNCNVSGQAYECPVCQLQLLTAALLLCIS